MTIRNLTARARILVALGVTSLALVAASPASAAYRGYEPGSDDAPTTTRAASLEHEDTHASEDDQGSCAIERGEGEDGSVAHGSTMNIYVGPDWDGTNVYQQLRCNDGTWEEVA